MAPQFESGFLRDDFGIRAKLGIPELPVPLGRDVNGKELVVEADVFIAWHKRAAPTLASRRHDLPMLYQVWLHRPQTTEKMGRAVYFEAGGEHYSVFASLAPTLFARKLPGGWLREKMLPAQKQSTGYAQTVIPRVEDQLPGTTLRPPDIDGNIPISAAAVRGPVPGQRRRAGGVAVRGGVRPRAQRAGRRRHARQDLRPRTASPAFLIFLLGSRPLSQARSPLAG